MIIELTRNSVAMGDDVYAPHDQKIIIPSYKQLDHLWNKMKEIRYLPSIYGGEATWILYRTDNDLPLAVVAQQWEKAKFFVQSQQTLAQCFEEVNRITLHFVYRAQENPDTVYRNLLEHFW